ncbi:methyltransferase domain-containing protein [Methylomonas sp. MgM2]
MKNRATPTASLDDALFAGIIGEEYQVLKKICPLAAEMSRLVGKEVAACRPNFSVMPRLVELGGGTGITTLSILSACEDVTVLSVDNEPTMQKQAEQSLRDWVERGRLSFSADDALAALRGLADESVNIVASAYTLHNFEQAYRKRVVGEIYRVLVPGGRFINGDRYALDDVQLHTRNTQQEVAGYFEVLKRMDRLDLLEQWVLHVIGDEAENRIMRESAALSQLSDAGFHDVRLTERRKGNALVTAVKAVAV